MPKRRTGYTEVKRILNDKINKWLQNQRERLDQLAPPNDTQLIKDKIKSVHPSEYVADWRDEDNYLVSDRLSYVNVRQGNFHIYLQADKKSPAYLTMENFQSSHVGKIGTKTINQRLWELRNMLDDLILDFLNNKDIDTDDFLCELTDIDFEALLL